VHALNHIPESFPTCSSDHPRVQATGGNIEQPLTILELEETVWRVQPGQAASRASQFDNATTSGTALHSRALQLQLFVAIGGCTGFWLLSDRSSIAITLGHAKMES
jgi:hypothetical protein